jgi:hypothetical protein
MKIKKIKFSGNIGNDIKNTFKQNETLFISLINDDSTDFENYSLNKDNTYIIPVKKDSDWNISNPAHFIYWYREVNQGRYLRVEGNKELSIGYKLDSEAYLELFITEEHYSKNEKSIEPKIIKWTNGLESFVDSTYVQKHSKLLKYLYWRGTDVCLPEYLYINFNLSRINDKFKVVKKFSEANNIQDFEEIIKELKTTK